MKQYPKWIYSSRLLRSLTTANTLPVWRLPSGLLKGLHSLNRSAHSASSRLNRAYWNKAIQPLTYSSLLSFPGFHQNLASTYSNYSAAGKNNFLDLFKLNTLKIRGQHYSRSERSKLLLQLWPSLHCKDITKSIP